MRGFGRNINGSGNTASESRVNKATDPGSAIFSLKNCSQALLKMIRDVYPGFGFFPIQDPDPGIKKAVDPGSLIRICNSPTSSVSDP
jgi:hypothetical protein